MATIDVRIKLNHLMGWGLVLPSFLPSCHLLKSIIFRIIITIEAEKNRTWKNLIMADIAENLLPVKLKFLVKMFPVIV
jgi:hypothetical protein